VGGGEGEEGGQEGSSVCVVSGEPGGAADSGGVPAGSAAPFTSRRRCGRKH